MGLMIEKAALRSRGQHPSRRTLQETSRPLRRQSLDPTRYPQEPQEEAGVPHLLHRHAGGPNQRHPRDKPRFTGDTGQRQARHAPPTSRTSSTDWQAADSCHGLTLIMAHHDEGNSQAGGSLLLELECQQHSMLPSRPPAVTSPNTRQLPPCESWPGGLSSWCMQQ